MPIDENGGCASSEDLIPEDQLWFHVPEMQERVAQAEADFRDGNSTRVETPDEAQELLDSLNEETRAALRQSEQGREVLRFESADSIFEDLGL
jgi:hypothetical protein